MQDKIAVIAIEPFPGAWMRVHVGLCDHKVFCRSTNVNEPIRTFLSPLASIGISLKRKLQRFLPLSIESIDMDF